jgi:Zn-dependent protease
MFFNLIPIPPLDGSSIIALFIPVRLLPKWYSIQHYAFPVLMIAIIVLPYVLNVNPISWYLDVTAGNLANLLFPFKIA